MQKASDWSIKGHCLQPSKVLPVPVVYFSFSKGLAFQCPDALNYALLHRRVFFAGCLPLHITHTYVCAYYLLGLLRIMTHVRIATYIVFLEDIPLRASSDNSHKHHQII